jgi:hypothetical protein
VRRRYAKDGDDTYAIQEALNGKAVAWLEKVGDEQYRR